MEDFLNLFKNRTVGYAALAFIIFTGVVDLKMARDPEFRPDANTGEHGRARDKLLDQLQSDINDLTFDIMALQKNCEDRYDKVSVILENHKVNLKHNQDMIADCLRRTQ